MYDYHAAIRKRSEVLATRQSQIQKQLKKKYQEENKNMTYKTAYVTHAITQNHKFDYDNVDYF